MMLNLIPTEHKEKICRDYIGRLVALSFLFIGFLAFIATVAKLPSYFLLSAKANTAKDGLNDLKNKEQFTLGEEMQVSIKDINTKLKRLSGFDSVRPVSEYVIEALLKAKTSGIKISSILYGREGVTSKVEVRGVSTNRDALQVFVKNLEANPDFSNVVLPISSLVKDRNIEFTITFSVSK